MKKLFKKIKKFFRSLHPSKYLLVLLIVIISALYIEYFNSGLFVISEDIFDLKDRGVNRFEAYFVVLLTYGLLAVGWTQLRGISEKAGNEFILKIDERYTSFEMLAPKRILHGLYCSKKSDQYKDRTIQHFTKISNAVREMSRDMSKIEEFIQLINFLDFLETIAYLTNTRQLKYKQVEETLGQSIIYYYLLYLDWIYINRKSVDQKYYIELEKYMDRQIKEYKNTGENKGGLLEILEQRIGMFEETTC